MPEASVCIQVFQSDVAYCLAVCIGLRTDRRSGIDRAGLFIDEYLLEVDLDSVRQVPSESIF